MGEMTRQDRVNLHKKQERTHSSTGEPDLNGLKEGVSTIRQTTEGTVEFTKVNNSLQKRVLSPSAAIPDLTDRTGGAATHTISNYVGVANNAGVSTAVATVAEVEASLATLVSKINVIIKTLREQKLIG
tara:strand:+ start:1839 stop:2225 length:387 start_codon:yes stop_codon:yes gene_type:complete